ncbi:hypothetical protein DEM27_00150 [Metarhizobium album]|uniref:Uncharacterized protein n=1 Tax=Metarhizobium album TaxID=2182425 RepID=A0A2U2DWH4_9HYPH|nr:hypothetical protein [Rhizobium album]PWE57660.1 hypothetical protein DEM27_00150 [Rhizobium album]
MAKNYRQIFSVVARETIEETRKALVALAKEKHAEVMRAAPQPTRFERFVDGKRGAPEDAVKAGGMIRYLYPRLAEVVQFALETLFDLSPVLSGEYRNSHVLLVNGVLARNMEGYAGGEVVITNVQPYARKIELGAMKMRVDGSSRVYFQAADMVRGRFGNEASIGFTYRAVVGGGIVSGRAGNKAGLRYPALVIEER